MSSPGHIHVIDPNFRRRARIAYELAQRNLHAEIYEDLEEFRARIPEEGAILIADELADRSLQKLREMLDSLARPLPAAAYSDEPWPEQIVDAMRHGMLDYLRWPYEPTLFEAALRRLADEGQVLARKARRTALAKAAIESLSERELEVLELMIAGDSNKEIGLRLGISPRTVEIHRGNMMRKLNARSPSDAVRLAMIAGLEVGDELPLLAA